MTDRTVPLHWSLARAPRLSGRMAIVTGATGGIGLEVAAGLAGLGCAVVLAARDPAKGRVALSAIRGRWPEADLRFALLDCASLASVAAFAASWRGPLDILVNNAAVTGVPRRMLTDDGFERQIGVNYLSHFALTARLRDALNAADGGGRVVNVASLAHRGAVLRLDDLQGEHAYGPMPAYRQSKLAMLMFALELHRRAAAHGWPLRAFAAHPGFARTAIIPNGPGGGAPGLRARIMQACFNLVAQSAADGARPILFAAVAPEAEPGAYYGPARLGETRGPPAIAAIFPQARDIAAAGALWTLSERLTGAAFP